MMANIVRQFFRQVVSNKKNKYPIPHIEGAERILADSSVLCCPICYEVYTEPPAGLRCGHTFCTQCIRQLFKCTDEKVCIECPFCREKIASNEVYKNFIVEDILKGMEQIANEETQERGRIATLRLISQRHQKRATELEQKNNQLQTEMDKLKKKRQNLTLAVGGIVITFVAYELLGAVASLFMSIFGPSNK